MDEFEKHRRKQEAWQRLRAQRRRAGELRGRVVAISLLGFVLLWVIVFAQMETGNDPVLGDGSAAAAVTRKTGGRQSDGPKAPAAEAGASTDTELEAEGFEVESSEAEALEAEALEAEALEAEALAAEEEFSEPEFVEEEPEFVEEELEPLTTSQS